jgi:hypothetical protein
MEFTIRWTNKMDGKRIREEGVKKITVVKFIWGLTNEEFSRGIFNVH